MMSNQNTGAFSVGSFPQKSRPTESPPTMVESIRDREKANQAIIDSGTLVDFIHNSSTPVCEIEIACDLELSVPLVRQECDRLLKIGVVSRDFTGSYKWTGITASDLQELRSCWRNNGWTRYALKEYLFSYHGISGFKDLKCITPEIASSIKEQLSNNQIKKEYLQ